MGKKNVAKLRGRNSSKNHEIFLASAVANPMQNEEKVKENKKFFENKKIEYYEYDV